MELDFKISTQSQLIKNKLTIFLQMSVARCLSIKQCQKYLTRQKSSKSKIEDIREKIKMKTPIGNKYKSAKVL